MDDATRRSIRRWTLSFLAIDAIFFFFVLWGWLSDPVGFSEFVQIPFFLYFTPFSIPFLLGSFLPNIAIPLQMATVSVIGVVCHGLLGALIGERMKRVVLSWYVTVPVALLVLFNFWCFTLWYVYSHHLIQ